MNIEKNKKNKLILLTKGFPFGLSEKPFIIPELSRLNEVFRIRILSCARQEQFEDEVNTTTLADDIEVEQVDTLIKPSFLPKLLPKCIFSRFWWHEIKCIICEHTLVIKRIYESTIFYMLAINTSRIIMNRKLLEMDVCHFVAYTFWNTSDTLALILLKSKYPGMRIISRAHGYDLYNYRYAYGRQPFKWLLDEKCDDIIFISDDGYKHWISNYSGADPMNRANYHINRLGVSAPICVNRLENWTASMKQRTFNLVSCSRVDKDKRISLIIKALTYIDSSVHINWTHFGDGSELPQIEKYARDELEKLSNIQYKFMGYTANEDVIKFYATQSIDCFITTTALEGLPVSIMEALAYGIPVIATNVNGIYEEVEENGILLDANPSPEQVTNAIMTVYKKNYAEVSIMREKSNLLWDERFNAENNIMEFVSFVNNMYS